MNNTLNKTLASLLAIGMLGAASAASAETAFQKHHPRRAEVMHRTRNLNHRIRAERREGDINGKQAAALHREVHQTATEQRDMAHDNGGYITKSQQKGLNQQENAISHQVGQ